MEYASETFAYFGLLLCAVKNLANFIHLLYSTPRFVSRLPYYIRLQSVNQSPTISGGPLGLSSPICQDIERVSISMLPEGNRELQDPDNTEYPES